jgi:hypothetical protein
VTTGNIICNRSGFAVAEWIEAGFSWRAAFCVGVLASETGNGHPAVQRRLLDLAKLTVCRHVGLWRDKLLGFKFKV